MTAEPERFFFVHLQKTGGTALFQRLRQCLGDAVYPTRADHGNVRAVADIDHLVEAFRAHRDTLRVVTGHFPLCTIDVLDAPFRTFTVLRDPVERTLSLLRRRRLVEERFHDLELEQIYDDPALTDIIRNHMVKMLSLTAAEMGPTPLVLHLALDESHLDTAKHNLEGVDVVGLQEHFEPFCDELSAEFGWDLGPPRYANRTPREPVGEGLRERIAADNQLDVELHRFAVDLVQSRGRRWQAARG